MLAVTKLEKSLARQSAERAISSRDQSG